MVALDSSLKLVSKSKTPNGYLFKNISFTSMFDINLGLELRSTKLTSPLILPIKLVFDFTNHGLMV